MNNTITLPQVITQLAKLTNTDSNTARLFLRAFFANIEKNLAAGETVVIKNIGTFKRSDDATLDGSASVMFMPDKAITDEINAPFAMFSAVELADGVNEADLAPAETQAPTEAEPEAPAQPEAETAVVAPEPEPDHSAAPTATEPQVTEPEVAEVTEPVAETIPAPAPEPAPEAAPEVKEPVAEPAEPIAAPEPAPKVEPKAAPAPVSAEPRVTAQRRAPVVPPVTKVVPEEPESEEETPAVAPARKSHVWLWAVLLIIVAVVGGYFAAVYAVPDFEWDDEVEAAEEAIPTEPLPEIDVAQAGIEDATPREEVTTPETAVEEPAPAPAAAPVVAEQKPEPKPEPAPAAASKKYDTVTATRYLSTMAREYYGHNIFWVYIYEANKDKLGNPNKVSAGTRVVIPDKSSLPKAANKKEAIRMAEKKAAEIQARFKK